MDIGHGSMHNMNMMVLELNVDIAFLFLLRNDPRSLKFQVRKAKLQRCKVKTKFCADAFREADQKI